MKAANMKIKKLIKTAEDAIGIIRTQLLDRLQPAVEDIEDIIGDEHDLSGEAKDAVENLVTYLDELEGTLERLGE